MPTFTPLNLINNGNPSDDLNNNNNHVVLSSSIAPFSQTASSSTSLPSNSLLHTMSNTNTYTNYNSSTFPTTNVINYQNSSSITVNNNNMNNTNLNTSFSSLNTKLNMNDTMNGSLNNSSLPFNTFHSDNQNSESVSTSQNQPFFLPQSQPQQNLNWLQQNNNADIPSESSMNQYKTFLMTATNTTLTSESSAPSFPANDPNYFSNKKTIMNNSLDSSEIDEENYSDFSVGSVNNEEDDFQLSGRDSDDINQNQSVDNDEGIKKDILDINNIAENIRTSLNEASIVAKPPNSSMNNNENRPKSFIGISHIEDEKLKSSLPNDNMTDEKKTGDSFIKDNIIINDDINEDSIEDDEIDALFMEDDEDANDRDDKDEVVDINTTQSDDDQDKKVDYSHTETDENSVGDEKDEDFNIDEIENNDDEEDDNLDLELEPKSLPQNRISAVETIPKTSEKEEKRAFNVSLSSLSPRVEPIKKENAATEISQNSIKKKKKKRKRDNSSSFVSQISALTGGIIEHSPKKKKKKKKKLSINVDSFIGLSTTESFSPLKQLPPSAPSNDTIGNGEMITGTAPLSFPEDKDFLTEMHCLVRANLELFTATRQDASESKPGRRTPIFVGRVGIRCVHCRKASESGPLFNLDQLTKSGEIDKRRNSRVFTSGSVSYPINIAAIYTQCAQKANLHFSKCPHLPEDVRSQFNALLYDQYGQPLRQKHSNAGFANAYYADSARRVGLNDSPEGIRFGRDPQMDPLPLDPNMLTILNNPTPNVKVEFGIPIAERVPLSDKRLEETLADTSGDDPQVLQPEDRNSVTDFVYCLLKQIKLTHANSFDNKKGHRNKNMRIGYSGFCCRHCAKRYEDPVYLSPSGGRFFSSAADNLCAAITNAFMAHLQKCGDVPPEIKQTLSALKRLHSGQISDLPTGAQRRFFHLLWKRLREQDNVSVNDTLPKEELSPKKTLSPVKSSITTRGGRIDESVISAPTHHSSNFSFLQNVTTPRDTSVIASHETSTPVHTNHTRVVSGVSNRSPAVPAAKIFAPSLPPLYDYANYYQDDQLTSSVIEKSLSLNDTSSDSKFASVVRSYHRKQITDYIFLIMLQLTTCRVEHNDFFRGKRSSTLAFGLAGLCCKYCVNSGLSNTGRSFPTTPDNIVSGTNVSYYNHVMKCPLMPANIKHAIATSKKTHTTQMSLLPHGSQRRFFTLIFKMLREHDDIKLIGKQPTVQTDKATGNFSASLNPVVKGNSQPSPRPNKMNFQPFSSKPHDVGIVSNVPNSSLTNRMQPTPIPTAQSVGVTSGKMELPSVPIGRNNTRIPNTAYSSVQTEGVNRNSSTSFPNPIPDPELLPPIPTYHHPASDNKLKRYAFIRTASNWWVCKYCRMVPLEFRSRGSMFGDTPTEKDIRSHRFICREDSFDLDSVFKTVQDMVQSIEGMNADLLVHPLFICIVRELVGGNEKLCDLFTNGMKSKLSNEGDQITTRGMWSLFPRKVDDEAVFHALKTFRNAKTGVSVDFVRNEHFCKFVCFLAPSQFDKDALEAMEKKLQDSANFDVEESAMFV